MDFEITNEKAVSIYITEFKSISPNSNANLGANSSVNSSPLNSQTPSGAKFRSKIYRTNNKFI